MSILSVSTPSLTINQSALLDSVDTVPTNANSGSELFAQGSNLYPLNSDVNLPGVYTPAQLFEEEQQSSGSATPVQAGQVQVIQPTSAGTGSGSAPSIGVVATIWGYAKSSFLIIIGIVLIGIGIYVLVKNEK